jgi:hypothetical protein
MKVNENDEEDVSGSNGSALSKRMRQDHEFESTGMNLSREDVIGAMLNAAIVELKADSTLEETKQT